MGVYPSMHKLKKIYGVFSEDSANNYLRGLFSDRLIAVLLLLEHSNIRKYGVSVKIWKV